MHSTSHSEFTQMFFALFAYAIYYCRKLCVWEVPREEEFSPIKNAETVAKDSPATARADLYSLHRSYILKAGGKIDCRPVSNGCNGSAASEMICEISPLVSYEGEGLEDIVKGRMMTPPILICSPLEHGHSAIDKKIANGGLVCGDGLTPVTNGSQEN